MELRTTSARHTGHRVLLVLAGVLALTGTIAAAAPGSMSSGTPGRASDPSDATSAVIVRGAPGGGGTAVRDVATAVAAAGGQVTRQLPVVDGVAAEVPTAHLDRLRSSAHVVAVTPDATGRVQAVDPSLGFDPAADTGSLGLIEKIIGADRLWAVGATGKGVDVAVIDTGVAPVAGLTSGNLVHGPDLSFDSQRPDLRYTDAFGHGTHMAGIIAGRDQIPAAGAPSGYRSDNARFTGVAPDARIVSLKVGAADGSADVSQVIAAIGWVAENGRKNGLNVRVLNLSYGTDSDQDYRLDPLAYAAEVAWRKGIVVVAAAGNDGTVRQDLASPALNPNILAVGAADPNGTLTIADDTLPDFSNRGTKRRYADVVAPGVHVLGLRVPNGVVDEAYPASRIGSRFTRGSGTSQATAVVSGAAALLISRYPALTPNQVKGALTRTASVPPSGTPKRMGTGVINVAAAGAAIMTRGAGALTAPTATFGTGTGLLDKARGTSRVVDHHAGQDVTLTGERDIFGRSWNAGAWAAAALAGTTWNSGSWNGSTWTGSAWDATPGSAVQNWATAPWTTNAWSGADWQGRTWVGRTWVAGAWDGRTWVNDSWVGRTWVGRTWVGRTWVGEQWSSASWT
jgi:serine protease AprX